MQKEYATLGLNFGEHDTAAALMVGDRILAACEEERYTRDKHSREFPINAIQDCLELANIELETIDEIAFGFDPVYHIQEAYLRGAIDSSNRLSALITDRETIAEKFNSEDLIRKKTGFSGKISFYRHHECHLASALYPSGFTDAIIASYDGLGEIETSLMAVARSGEFDVFHSASRFPHSLGLLYSAVTHFLGWKHHCDEGIVMGLAAYGNPHQKAPSNEESYIDVFRDIIRVTGDFDYEIDQSYFTYGVAQGTWVSPKFVECFGGERQHQDSLEQRHMDLASALQLRLEEIVLGQLEKARDLYKIDRLCLAGGVALNCSMNGKIEQSGLFDEIFVQPASGDAGVALGACFLAQKAQGIGISSKPVRNFYLGSCASKEQVSWAFKQRELTPSIPEDVFAWTASRLAEGKIVGWFQGRAEFGPRALGNRSILTRPFPAEMKDYLNSRVKFRESFRPFAPAVLEEHQSEYFAIGQSSPHMLIATQAKLPAQEKAPATVHVDNSCRVQSVNKSINERFHKLLSAFKSQTDCPVLLNTSFNVKGQPIVNTPSEAIDCFLSTNIDCLVIDDYVIEKQDVMDTVTSVKPGNKVASWAHFGAQADTYGDDYKEKVHKKYPANRYRLEIVKSILDKTKPKKILDVGCGTGDPLIALSKMGFDIKGFDVSPKMVAKAKQNISNAGLDPNLISLEDMENPVGLARESFDCLMALGSVYYANDFLKTMSNLSRLLLPEGNFIFSLRNELFSLFSTNRYTKDFLKNHLIPTDGLPEALQTQVETFLSERYDKLEHKKSFDTVDTQGVQSIMHNPLSVQQDVLDPLGLELLSLSFYHYHPLPPIFEHMHSEIFRSLGSTLEIPRDWKGYFMASSFVVHAKKSTKN